MRVPVYLLCAALIVMVRCEDGANSNSNNNNNYNNMGHYLEPINVAADQETISYLLPKLTAKYRPNNDWSGVSDPRFYVLTEMESNDIDNQALSSGKKVRNKRYEPKGPLLRGSRSGSDYHSSLSVQAPIETLRDLVKSQQYLKKMRMNRYLLENLPNDQ